jgi:hypothetical protein
MSTFKDVLASIVGSTACVYTGQPFDTVKVRMQVQPGYFKSSIDCFIKTFQAEGIRTLWRGSVPALTGALSENAVAFGVNGVLKRTIFNRSTTDNADRNDNANHNANYNDGDDGYVKRYLYPFLSGGITGLFTSTVLCPCDVVKCRAQLSRAQGINLTVAQIMVNILNSNGIRGFYVGISAQIFRDIPFYASFFGTYALCCEYLRANNSYDFSDTFVYFLSGG